MEPLRRSTVEGCTSNMRDDTWETTEDGAWEYNPEYVDKSDLEEGVCGKCGTWLSGRGDGATMSRHCDECGVMVAIY